MTSGGSDACPGTVIQRHGGRAEMSVHSSEWMDLPSDMMGAVRFMLSVSGRTVPSVLHTPRQTTLVSDRSQPVSWALLMQLEARLIGCGFLSKCPSLLRLFRSEYGNEL